MVATINMLSVAADWQRDLRARIARTRLTFELLDRSQHRHARWSRSCGVSRLRQRPHGLQKSAQG
jgi:hypothetical protein